MIATKRKLDDWVKATPTEADAVPKRWPLEETNKLGAQFLQIDSEIALTFSGLALEARDEGKRRRCTHTARRAYDAIVRLRKRIQLTGVQRDKLEANLERLKAELERLGD